MDFCRICTVSTAEHSKIFSISENVEPLADMIYDISGLEVTKNDGLPDIVCEICVKDLKSALNLKRKCLESDKKLRQMMQTENLSNTAYEETVETDVPVISFKIVYEEEVEYIPPRIEGSFSGQSKSSITKDPCKIAKPINSLLKDTRVALHMIPEPTHDVNQKDPKPKQHIEYEEVNECTPIDESESTLHENSDNQMMNSLTKYISVASQEDSEIKQTLGQIDGTNGSNYCCGCEQVFQTKNELSLHSNEVHKPHRTSDDKKLFECAVCYKRYTTHRGFTIHKKNVLKFKNHQCSSCGKIFSNSRVLENHERIHSAQKPFPCHTCSKSFRSKSNLLSHVKLHSAVSESTRHVCNICNKGFSRKSYLKYHNNLLHSEETPFACSFCPSKFKANANLRLHMRTHTQERPYSCDLCDKTFMYPTDKKRHVLQHLGQKPFKCQDCDKAFTRKTLLQKHRLNCHGELTGKFLK